MSPRACLFAALLPACATEAPAPAPKAPPPSDAVALAAADLLCPSVRGHIFSTATAHGDARDAYAEVISCEARAEGGAVRVRAVLAVWLGVSLDQSGVRLDQYLHATLAIDAAYTLRATYERGRLVAQMRPSSPSRVSVTPVGGVGVSATNWLTLLAGELAQARGTTPEWIAREHVRTVAEQMLHDTLDRQLAVCLDVIHDRALLDCREGGDAGPATPAPDEERLWIAPRGTAFLGPFPPGSARQIALRRATVHAVFRGLCLDDFEIIASHDRRGEAAPLEDWEPLETGAPAVIARGCPWGLAVRSADLGAGEVSIEVRPSAPSGSSAGAARRWVAVRVIESTLEYSIAPAELWLESATEAIRIDGGGAKAWVAELADGESIHLRVRAKGRGTLLGEAPVPVAARETIDLRADAAIAHATIEASASAAPRAAAW